MATDKTIIEAALNLLAAGLLPSALPGRLMSDYGITPARARRLAGEAVKRWRGRE